MTWFPLLGGLKKFFLYVGQCGNDQLSTEHLGKAFEPMKHKVHTYQ